MTDLLIDLKTTLKGTYGTMLEEHSGSRLLRGQILADGNVHKCIAARQQGGRLEIGFATAWLAGNGGLCSTRLDFTLMRGFEGATPAAAECFTGLAKGLAAGCGD